MTSRACPRCGRATTGRYCPEHEPERTAARKRCRGRAWRRLRAEVLERDGYVCQVRIVCDGAPATVADHIVAAVDGGPDTAANLRASCAPCNLARGCGAGGPSIT